MEYKFDVDYKAMYLKLFNAVTDAIEQINSLNFGAAQQILEKAQLDCEEIYVE